MKKLIFLLLSFVLFLIIGNNAYSQPTLYFDLSKFYESDFKTDFYKFIEARRGGGSRGGGSFGRSRSSSNQRAQQAPRARQNNAQSSNPAKTPSFGGKRITKEQATAKYGIPRKTTEVTSNNQLGQPMNYRLNDYGGFSSGLMYGYMMGNMAWWMTVPAFFYSKPVYAENDDGTVDVYPPTFNFGKFFLTLIIIFVIVYFIRAMIRARKSIKKQESSFI